jgi:hypothetical protein
MMNMRTYSALLKAIACLIPFGAQAGQIVNIDATNAAGTSVTLGPGTYEVNVIGTAQGGHYNGWDFATQNFGTPSATPAPNDWVDYFAITVNGVQTTYILNGDPMSSSAAGALATYQSSVLYANGTTPASASPNTAIFTVTSTQSVNFAVADYFFADNWGGTSLYVSNVSSASATPEPSPMSLMAIAITGALAAMLRRKSR